MWLHIPHDIRDFRPIMNHIPRPTRVIAANVLGDEIAFGSRFSPEREKSRQTRKGRFERLSTRHICHLVTLFRKIGWPEMQTFHVPNVIAAVFILLVSTQVIAADFLTPQIQH